MTCETKKDNAVNTVTLERLNAVAMEIIMSAGDARKLLTDAIDNICADSGEQAVNRCITDAKHALAKAHNRQTELIQESIDQENQVTSLLFNHAQDTLMTINSEMNMVKSMIKLYNKLNKGKM